MGDGTGRLRAGQGDDPRDDSRRDRRGAGLAGLVPKQAVDALFGEAPLPTPDRRATDASAVCNFQHRQSVAGDLFEAFAVAAFRRMLTVWAMAPDSHASTTL